ncbi:acetyl-CoA carboxylase carboxyltransferase subunit alpha [Sellimonas caecigallum]|uniref:Multifunctional fusion protein n=1 Tax=Sellimonas caecigallum TaxID=2592333 RepID=A0ABS7L5G6_9FIRM|nr:acetyl-CoA carboxylase carboxyltransferase subunit alpha [Sellimonas caecigallum]MBY0758217.1 acetyl-CoA carboxylase carboxyltransferase subunit beta [Sellimonas caecigallum]OUP67062.1 acetyl-CoA carboxylase carboxyl transferase subunit beta [Drancourtella sp. An177]
MKLKDMFKKTNRKNYISIHSSDNQGRPEVPEGLLKKCNACKAAIVTEDVKSNYYICPKCHNYFRVHARRRVEMIADEGTFEEWDQGLTGGNPLSFPGYEEKVKALQEKTGLDEAVLTGKAKIGGVETVLGVCDGRFMMASMGEAVGEKIARAVERATSEKLPVIIFACSGGARMQEGIVSLMQMAKTSAALKRHSDAGLLYISVLTNPTTGGVTASFAMLGDIILAEPKALIGFAGPRVIEQTIRQKLPEGFQKSEFLLEHGFIDRIVEREEMKEVLTEILKMHERCEDKTGGCTDCCSLVKEEEHTEYKGLTSWERVQISRKKERPVGSEYIKELFDGFIEFHGDRYFKDDRAIIGGIARFHGVPVTVIAQEKGTTTKENIEHNFGMPSPDGYRKALRLMKQAEKFHRPVICFVDTPGAFCGLEAEERGQGEAIARNLYEMSSLKTPIVSIVIGEGASGGALAIALADEVWMLENSIYTILSPEGFASILWKDAKRAKEAAGVMKLTANHLKSLDIVERVIAEPENFTTANLQDVTDKIDAYLAKFICDHAAMDVETLVEKRYQRFRRI